MIDEVLEFVVAPSVCLVVQVMILLVNDYLLRESKRLHLFKAIIFLISTPLVFTATLSMILAISTNYALVYVSLCLFFIQLCVNIEYLLQMKVKSQNV